MFGCRGGNWIGALKYLEPVSYLSDPNAFVRTPITNGLGITFDATKTDTFKDKVSACSQGFVRMNWSYVSYENSLRVGREQIRSSI